MATWPKTDAALIAQLSNPADHDAWRSFDSTYRLVIYRFARRNGQDHHGAEEIAAEVLRRVARVSVRWATNRPPDHLAAWLTRVSKNALLNLVCRELGKRGTGGTTHQLNLLQRPTPTQLSQTRWSEDYQREIFRQAAERIRGDFDSQSWNAFWQTHVEGEPIAIVAKELGKSHGAIYAIRSRVMRRLRSEVKLIESEMSNR